MHALALLVFFAVTDATLRMPHRHQQQPFQELFNREPRHHVVAASSVGEVSVAVAAASSAPIAGHGAFAAVRVSGGSGGAAAALAGVGGPDVYPKRRPGRHVCAREQAVPERTQSIETYSKPSYITYLKPCHDRLGMCNAVRTVYHEAYRTVTKTHFKKRTSYACCPGWTQLHKHQHGCRKAICSRPCMNRGSCSLPDTCACPPGYTGSQCQTDLNECKEKPCDHTCINTEGSFHCVCHDGFQLLDDGRTCRSKGNITATEAKDLEDFEILSQRLLKLEEMHLKDQPANAEFSIRELNNKIEAMKEQILQLKEQLENVKRSQSSSYQFLEELKSYQPQIERISPLCKQVSNIEQQVLSCPCRNELQYRFKPHILS